MGVNEQASESSDVRGQVRRAEALLRSAASGIASLRPSEAVDLARSFSEIAKFAYASSLRCVQLAGDARARRESGETSAAALLSTLCGTSVGKARTALALSEHAASSPALSRAFRDGALSIEQVGLIAPVATQDPLAAEALVAAAKTTSLRLLRQEVDRIRRARAGEQATRDAERLLHARRYCRTWVPEGGGLRVDALLDAVDGARFKAVLDDRQAQLEVIASRAGTGSSHDQLRADALVAALGDGVAGGSADHRCLGRPEMLVRVDAAALRRGEVVGGETCEVAGIGPVSVGTARSVLGEALWTLLVFEGQDVSTVTSTKRAVPKKVENALLARDRTCVVPGCGASERLEVDHWALDYSWKGPTELANLCRLCPAHHRMKTRTGWRLTGGPGRWCWSPPRPVTLLARARSRHSSGPRAPTGGTHEPKVRDVVTDRDPSSRRDLPQRT